MNPIVTCAEHVLRVHVHPALRLNELRELVAERVDRGLDIRTLRAMLEEHPELFRVIEPWSGPWRLHDQRRGHGRPPEAWVVVITDPGEGPDTSGAALRLRESVRWLARDLDVRSPLEVGRWYAIVLAEREARLAVVRRAA